MTPHAYLPPAVVDAWPRLSPKARTVAVALASYMPGDGGACWPGRVEIMGRAGLRKAASVSRALAELRGAGLVVTRRRPNRASLYEWAKPEGPQEGTTGRDTKGHNREPGKATSRPSEGPQKGTRKDTKKVKGRPSYSRAQVASAEAPRFNAWGLWVDCWREAGRTPDPLPLGPATRAAKELARLIPDRDELADVFAAFLGDGDKWLVSQGHSLSLLPKRVDGYRARLAEADPPPLSPETIERIEAEAAAAERART